jgi:leucine-rich PPR motif-containing protein
MLALGCHLSTKIKKDVSYDNRLCNAYLSAGRGAEFLDLLVRDLAMAVRVQDPEMLHIIQERFPRGGAMGLLDNHPELLDKVRGGNQISYLFCFFTFCRYIFIRLAK